MKSITLILVLSFSIFGFASAKEWRDPVTGMQFVWVPGGSFEMGCHANAGRCFDNERPTRTVRLDGFWMGKHEVTLGQMIRILGLDQKYYKKPDNHPVGRVYWDTVQDFIQRLNARSKLNARSPAKFRLPSEAQWEYACRAGGKPVTFGTTDGRWNTRSGNGSGTQDGHTKTAPVGSYPPNTLGLHDMSGNVMEWVQDKLTVYGNVGIDNPIYERSGAKRVFRGGSYHSRLRTLRCSYRSGSPLYTTSEVLGFRLVSENKTLPDNKTLPSQAQGRFTRRRAALPPQWGTIWRDPVTGMAFVKVPGGSFEMGCHANAGRCFDKERPTRTVRLDGFWLGKHEVTQGQWKRIMGSNPSYSKHGDNYPVENVSWNDIQEFIRKLNTRSSATFRLPSEAQWEYACRTGGKSVTFGTGNGRLSLGNANFSQNYGATTPVGDFQANTLGLHDMAGNVWEWVQDKLTVYGNVGIDNPIYERSGAKRVFRGGGFANKPRHQRCSVRRSYEPSSRYFFVGFRLLRVR